MVPAHEHRTRSINLQCWGGGKWSPGVADDGDGRGHVLFLGYIAGSVCEYAAAYFAGYVLDFTKTLEKVSGRNP